MDKKSLAVIVLSLSAATLFLGNLLMPARSADAQVVVKDRDYQVMTAYWQANDQALIVVDNRSGQMAAFVYDQGARGVVLRAVRPVMDAFAGR